MGHKLIIAKSPSYKGMKIARLQSENKKYDGAFIYVVDDGDEDNNDSSGAAPIEFKKEDGVRVFPFFEHMKGEKQVFHTHVIGQTGSGKSYCIGECLDQIIHIKPKLNKAERQLVAETGEELPKGNIVIFSGAPEDEPLIRPRGVRTPIRVDLDDPALFDIKLKDDLKDSICIFDDIDDMTNKKVRDFLIRLRGDVTATGRHYGIDSFNVSHSPMLGPVTKSLNAETGAVIVFPRYNITKKLENYLDTYVDLDKAQIVRIKNLPSRYVYIRKRYPRYVVYERGAYLL
jgi:hypothetical protein